MDDPPVPDANAPSFPQDPAEFDADPRISFSKLDNKYILETENGDEYMYEPVLKRWILSVGSFASLRSRSHGRSPLLCSSLA